MFLILLPVPLSGLLLEMATPPEDSKATALKTMLKFPVLPPIEDDVGREIVNKITAQKKLLRHRRSKVQRDQLHKIMYVSIQLWKVKTSITATTTVELFPFVCSLFIVGLFVFRKH